MKADKLPKCMYFVSLYIYHIFTPHALDMAFMMNASVSTGVETCGNFLLICSTICR